jgi:hypothetical protein
LAYVRMTARNLRRLPTNAPTVTGAMLLLRKLLF